MPSDLDRYQLIWFQFTCFANFCNKIERCQWKRMSDLNISYGKMAAFVPFPLFGFTLVTKQRKLDFESHWNTLYFLIRINGFRFDFVLSSSAWLSLISIVWEEFFNKLKNVDFELYWNRSNIFHLRNLFSDQNLSCFFVLFVFCGIAKKNR